MFNTTASITCWTSGTILDSENRSPVWKSNVWQSVRVASRGHLLSLFDDNAQFRFPALAGRSEPEQEKWGHYPVLTPTTPPFPDPSRSWHTHSHSHSLEHTHTWTESVWPHLVHYLHRSRCGQHHCQFSQTNHSFRGIQTLWKLLWDSLNAGLLLTEKPTWGAYLPLESRAEWLNYYLNICIIYINDRKRDVNKIAETK